MFRQLNFRSFFNFLGRNKLYAAINIFGLSVSLMFVILIADYTLRQLTCDDYHAKADRTPEEAGMPLLWQPFVPSTYGLTWGVGPG